MMSDTQTRREEEEMRGARGGDVEEPKNPRWRMPTETVTPSSFVRSFLRPSCIRGEINTAIVTARPQPGVCLPLVRGLTPDVFLQLLGRSAFIAGRTVEAKK